MEQILLIVVIILSIFSCILLFLILRLNKKYKNFISKFDSSPNIEEKLQEYLNKVNIIGDDNTNILNQIKYLTDNSKQCLNSIGIVKYNVYKNTANNSCFALAILDSNNCGIILNVIYSTEMSNVYVKEVINGTVKEEISEEESQALIKAMSK